jgi:hypothetical protein
LYLFFSLDLYSQVLLLFLELFQAVYQLVDDTFLLSLCPAKHFDGALLQCYQLRVWRKCQQ